MPLAPFCSRRPPPPPLTAPLRSIVQPGVVACGQHPTAAAAEPKMYLMYYTNEKGERVYTLQVR